MSCILWCSLASYILSVYNLSIFKDSATPYWTFRVGFLISCTAILIYYSLFWAPSFVPSYSYSSYSSMKFSDILSEVSLNTILFSLFEVISIIWFEESLYEDFKSSYTSLKFGISFWSSLWERQNLYPTLKDFLVFYLFLVCYFEHKDSFLFSLSTRSENARLEFIRSIYSLSTLTSISKLEGEFMFV
jgi:hypothetical protein